MTENGRGIADAGGASGASGGRTAASSTTQRILAQPPRLTLGRYPTPVQLLPTLSSERSELWVKRDDLTNPTYGGNKVRKLEWLLGEALARGRRRLVTVGATGSHHVLATTYFGRQAGLEIEAVLVPQPEVDAAEALRGEVATAEVLAREALGTGTGHGQEMLRASLAQGLRAFPVRSLGAAALVTAWRIATGAHFITVGGSNVAGTMGYVNAASELASQIRAGELPEPDICVVALGSGGTAAGLAAGFEAEGLKTRVIGVCVSQPPWAVRLLSLHLARACARKLRIRGAWARMRVRLVMDTRFLGRGYGYETAAGQKAAREASAVGLTLDPTYTEKAFACALSLVREREETRASTDKEAILYWHTLSSAPMGPLLHPPRP